MFYFAVKCSYHTYRISIMFLSLSFFNVLRVRVREEIMIICWLLPDPNIWLNCQKAFLFGFSLSFLTQWLCHIQLAFSFLSASLLFLCMTSFSYFEGHKFISDALTSDFIWNIFWDPRVCMLLELCHFLKS